MSAPQRPLTGEQVLQRIDAGATGRELITAADAAAARDAIEAQQQNDGLDYLSGLSNLAEPTFIGGSKTLLTADGWEPLNYQTATLTADHVWLGASTPGAPPVEFETGAKGRDLLALANDAALQAELEARLAGATIAPAVINATGKLSTTSTADDSIETAGGIRIAPAAASSPGTLFQLGVLGVGGNGTSVNARGAQAWFLRSGADVYTGRVSFSTPANHPGIIFFDSADGKRTDIRGAAASGGGIDFAFDAVVGVRFGGTNPASATSGETNIGNGTIDTAARVIARSTAADAIESLGGIEAAGVVSGGNFKTISGNDSAMSSGTWTTIVPAIAAGVYLVTTHRGGQRREIFSFSVVVVDAGGVGLVFPLLTPTNGAEVRVDSGNLQMIHTRGFTTTTRHLLLSVSPDA